MNDYLLKLDDHLKPFLQRNIKFLINSQPYKEGKFILYTYGYFSVHFHIKNYRKHKTEILKLPLPFNYEPYPDENLLYLDYRLHTFAHDAEIIQLINKVKNPILSRFYDKIVTIETYKHDE